LFSKFFKFLNHGKHGFPGLDLPRKEIIIYKKGIFSGFEGICPSGSHAS
jgi:hypothetical protein